MNALTHEIQQVVSLSREMLLSAQDKCWERVDQIGRERFFLLKTVQEEISQSQFEELSEAVRFVVKTDRQIVRYLQDREKAYPPAAMNVPHSQALTLAAK